MYKKIGVTVLALTLLGLILGSTMITAIALTVSTKENKKVYYPGEEVIVTGTATPNTVVALKMLNPEGDLVTADQVKTAGDGSFTIKLFKFPAKPTDLIPYGTYTIIVYDPSTNENHTLTIEFLPAKAIIKGTVVDPQGNPIAGALVKLSKDGSLIASNTTNDIGVFVFEVEVGTYTLSVEKDGYTTYTTTVEVAAPGETISLNIKLEPISLRIDIVEVTHNDKPFLGVVREGEILRVTVNVTFGEDIVADADVKAYIKPPKGATGIEEVSFTLAYDNETRLYVGEITIPSVGIDRRSTLEVKASWQGHTAEQSTEMFILVDYEAQISNLTSIIDELRRSLNELRVDYEAQISNLTSIINELGLTVDDLRSGLDELRSTVNELRSTVLDLQMSLGELSIGLSRLENTVSSLGERVSVLRETVGELEFNVERLSVGLNMLNASVTALNQRLSGLESRVAGLGERVTSMEESLNKIAGNVQQSINTLSEQVTNLGKSLDNLASTMNTNISNLKQAVDTVSSALYATLAIAIIALVLSIIVLVLVFRKIKG